MQIQNHCSYSKMTGILFLGKSLTTNHLVTVEENTAKCHVNFQAQHFLPNDRGSSLWTVGGRYLYSLIRTKGEWKIYGCVIHVAWTDGNLQIFDLAHEQAK
jgi:hypothetical protein